jgi:hypothetical protein
MPTVRPAALLLLLPFLSLELDGVTEATAPIVAEGTGRSPPFIDSDSEDSVANPTDLGFERKTE